jgi:hypothetical protein
MYTQIGQRDQKRKFVFAVNKILLMMTIMEGASNVITYVDDMLIHSATHEAHIAHLRHAIQRTHKAGLALNPKKCIFGSTSVEY